MIDPQQLILSAAGLQPMQFPSTSRYYGLDSTTMQMGDGRTVRYLRRRFVPQPEQFALLQEHEVTQGERLDNITAHYLGDPELFWRVCDANRAMRPDELTETIGRRLRITQPVGLPGNGHA